jgi:hypothetical protein
MQIIGLPCPGRPTKYKFQLLWFRAADRPTDCRFHFFCRLTADWRPRRPKLRSGGRSANRNRSGHIFEFFLKHVLFIKLIKNCIIKKCAPCSPSSKWNFRTFLLCHQHEISNLKILFLNLFKAAKEKRKFRLQCPTLSNLIWFYFLEQHWWLWNLDNGHIINVP